ncbi:MAG: hypothetical protein H7Y11_12950 [Armatimonadetes bacterium]|nr:hypothetical protein [Anaerolineae bacterium]
MTTPLPKFKPRPVDQVEAFLRPLLTNPQVSEDTQLRAVITYSEGYYRAVFDAAYFVLVEDETEPTKSQWNTLKKKLKRRESKLFILKAHGALTYEDAACYYIELGFFAANPPSKRLVGGVVPE